VVPEAATGTRHAAGNTGQPIFYYDLGSPECYLVAEAVMPALPVVPEWEPVHGAALGLRIGDPLDRESIEARAAELSIQVVRWPVTWPPDTHEAMLAATFAKRGGRAVAFSLAAFRQAFAAGRDLGDRDTVLIAGAAAEMHPAAIVKGITMRSVRHALDAAVERARTAGVRSPPAIQVGDDVFHGEHCVGDAAAVLGAAA
jgi:2-hydroxychromene-2-carboxylate isomerase